MDGSETSQATASALTHLSVVALESTWYELCVPVSWSWLRRSPAVEA